jgi:phosphoribosylamine-glycine ligase
MDKAARPKALKKPVSRTSDTDGVVVLGVGSFAHSTAQILRDNGARVCTWLSRSYGHYAPSLAGRAYSQELFPSPLPLLRENPGTLLIPQSIDWAQSLWARDLLSSNVPIFSPVGEGMKIERERDYARQLCQRFRIPFPSAHLARNRLEAEDVLRQHPQPFVIKNPLCSPTSPVHTICCESLADTRAWLRHVNYAEGIFLQEYLGRREVGHIALVSGGEIFSLVTNQEYKRAFAGNQGIVAGAPLGGLAELDPEDRYGLARELLHPLMPWFRRVKYHGPIQVTAARHKGRWHVIEYNVRIGVTSGAMLLRMLKEPFRVVRDTCRNRKLKLEFHPNRTFGCSVTLAGHGYPYVQISGPQLPVEVRGKLDCDVWWNEVGLNEDGQMMATGHRIGDVIGIGRSLSEARRIAYRNIARIRSLGSYYRPDIGESLWPPGSD